MVDAQLLLDDSSLIRKIHVAYPRCPIAAYDGDDDLARDLELWDWLVRGDPWDRQRLERRLPPVEGISPPFPPLGVEVLGRWVPRAFGYPVI